MRKTLFIALILFISCSSENQKSIDELNEAILKRPIIGGVDYSDVASSSSNGFQHENSSFQFFLIREFNDSLSNGFYGPVTSDFTFEQFISFDLISDYKWEVINQTVFPGRMVQNAKKGDIEIEQTLFFMDSLVCDVIYSIRNASASKQEISPLWTYHPKREMKLQKRIGYGFRFLTETGEYWPHSSGEDDLHFNNDSTIITKKMKPIVLFPNEKIDLFSALFIQENLDTIKVSNRPKPWLHFPKEELAKNIQNWGKKIN